MDNAAILLAKTRRLLIDLNRLIAEEDARYNRKRLALRPPSSRHSRAGELARAWDGAAGEIRRYCQSKQTVRHAAAPAPLDSERLAAAFLQQLPAGTAGGIPHPAA